MAVLVGLPRECLCFSGTQLADGVVLEVYSSIPPFSTVAVHRVIRNCRRSCTGLGREFVARAGPCCGCGESAPSRKVQSTPPRGTVRFQEVWKLYPLHRIIVVPLELLSACVYAIVLGGQSRVSDGVVQRWISVGEGGGG